MSSSSDEMKSTREKMLSFIESLRQEKCEEDLISLVQNIEEGSLEFPVNSFAIGLFRTKLTELLARGFALKALNEEQILSFFDALFKNEDFYFKLGGSFIEDIARYGDNDTTRLPSQLMSIYFKYAAECKSEKETRLALGSLLRSTSINIVIESYTLKSKEEQEKLLRFFLEAIMENSDLHNVPELVYKLKVTNSKIFKKVFDKLDENSQFLINKKLYSFNPHLMSLIKKNKFTEAAEAFMYHPQSPVELAEHLDSPTEKILTKKQINRFFKELLDSNTDDSILSGFTAMRVCFESKNFMDKHPNLFKEMMGDYLICALNFNETKEICELLSSKPSWYSYILAAYNEKITRTRTDQEREELIRDFLQACTRNSNSLLIQGLRKSNPNLFDKVLNLADEATKKIIQALLESSVQAEEKVTLERTLIEENQISSFIAFLKDPKNFSSAIDSLAISYISRVIDGKFFQGRYPNLPKTLI